jgi:hypothetical protein
VSLLKIKGSLFYKSKENNSKSDLIFGSPRETSLGIIVST